MTATGSVIDGKAIARRHREELKRQVAELKNRKISPKLSVVWIGEDPAAESYYKAKERLAKSLDIQFEGWKLPGSTSERELVERITALNADVSVHGILVEMPLPDHVNPRIVSRIIAAEKDVDGMTYYNQGRLYVGRDAFIPATPYGVMKLLEACSIDLQGMDAVVVGHGDVVGKPLSTLLLKSNATVTVCHEYTKDLALHTRRAELLCSATGVPHLIKADMVKPDAIVIDIGYAEDEEGVVGDVDFENVKEIASLITPVRGGVGSMTSTMIMANTIKAARQQSADV